MRIGPESGIGTEEVDINMSTRTEKNWTLVRRRHKHIKETTEYFFHLTLPSHKNRNHTKYLNVTGFLSSFTIILDSGRLGVKRKSIGRDSDSFSPNMSEKAEH